MRRAASAPHGPDGPLYTGACRDLTRERARSPPGARPHAGAARAHGGRRRVRDDLQGPQRELLERTSGDIVLRRSDGVVAYQLAVVVDDADQGVTHVVRGADLLASTARQLRLYELLGLTPVPGYAHVPLLLGDDGERLAKRHGAVGLDGAARGRAPIRARSSAGSRTAPASSSAPEPCTPGELVERFDPGALVARGAARIDPARLRW